MVEINAWAMFFLGVLTGITALIVGVVILAIFQSNKEDKK